MTDKFSQKTTKIGQQSFMFKMKISNKHFVQVVPTINLCECSEITKDVDDPTQWKRQTAKKLKFQQNLLTPQDLNLQMYLN